MEPPHNEPNVARVLLSKVRLERVRQFGNCFVGLELWKRLGLDRFYEQLLDGEAAMCMVAGSSGSGHQSAVCAWE